MSQACVTGPSASADGQPWAAQPGVSPPELDPAPESLIALSLQPVTAGLSGLYGLFTVSHWLLLPDASAVPLISTAGILFVLWLVLRCGVFPVMWAPIAGAGLASLAVGNSLLHLALSGEAWQTLNLLPLVMGVGFFFLSTRWLLLLLIATGLGWGGVVWTSAPSPLWLHFGFALGTASVLAVLVHTSQLRTARQRLQAEAARRQTQTELEQRLQARTAELAQANSTLRQREEYFRALLENASDVITVMGGDGTFHYQSPGTEQLLGYRLADAGRQAGFPFVHPDDRDKAEVAFDTAVQQPGAKVQTEVRLRHQDGSWRTVEASALNLLHTPAVGGILVNLHDITERKQAEEALRAAKEYADLLIQSSLDIIIAVDTQRRITEFNPAAEHTFGYHKAEILGQSMDLLYADPAVGEQLHHQILHKDGVATEVWNKRKTGETFVAYVAASVMRDPTGQIVGVMGISRDITEQKRADAALRQSKETAEAANRAKSEFLAMMSHELRTPLHLILGYTDLLTEGTVGTLPTEALAILAKVHTKAGELIELITTVLDVSHMETDQLTVEVTSVSVPELLVELQAETQDLQQQSGLTFVWQVAEQLPSLVTDPGKLKIVLKNLVGNAVKFTAQGQVSISAQGEAGGVVIAVMDTGIGIPSEALGVIFEPFHQVDSSNTRPYGGTGLGLYIVKRLVALLGGTVTVTSTVGQGSTFRVWLPARLPSGASSGS